MEMKPLKVIMHNRNEVETQYVNSFAVYGNLVEFVLEFGYVDLPNVVQEKERLNQKGKDLTEVVATTKTKLVMPANQIQSLILTLQNQLNDLIKNQK